MSAELNALERSLITKYPDLANVSDTEDVNGAKRYRPWYTVLLDAKVLSPTKTGDYDIAINVTRKIVMFMHKDPLPWKTLGGANYTTDKSVAWKIYLPNEKKERVVTPADIPLRLAIQYKVMTYIPADAAEEQLLYYRAKATCIAALNYMSPRRGMFQGNVMYHWDGGRIVGINFNALRGELLVAVALSEQQLKALDEWRQTRIRRRLPANQ
jgi:hypothetical protein